MSFDGSIKSIYKNNGNDDILINFKDSSSKLRSVVYFKNKKSLSL